MYDYLGYIHTQLNQRQITPRFQQFRFLFLDTVKTRYEIPAYNEIVFMHRLSRLPPGTLIHSDSRAMVLPSDVLALETVEDFSGLVTIELPSSLPGELTLEYVQITL